MTAPRTVLMLQGPPCRFWRELGDALRRDGRRVLHVGFCLADLVFWRRPGLRLYRGRLRDWPRALDRIIAAEKVSDILYYADRLPYHRAAITAARRAGIRAWAIENGYLRPDWITMEPEAMGAFSRLPRDPAAISALAAGQQLPDLAPQYRHGFAREAASEVAFGLAMTLGRPFFPRYVSDKALPPIVDHLSWLVKWARGTGAAPGDGVRLAAGGDVLLAMQLQTDYQIRASSPFRCLSEMIEAVLASFAAHARAPQRLIVKLHPMDNGLEAWPRRIRQAAARHGVGPRVVVVDGGDLEALLRDARGLITVNSTVGLKALTMGCPVIALGDAVYDIAGLTHAGGLDSFWAAPTPVDRGLCARFVTALAARAQIRGSFYAPAGRAAAIREIVRRLQAPDGFWQGLRPSSSVGLRRRGSETAKARVRRAGQPAAEPVRPLPLS
ncbi:MAG: capsule biosynthesis protein [Pikeienuella sp.]